MSAWASIFGQTIASVEDEEPLPMAYEMISHVIHKFGAENVFLVSKACPCMEMKIRQWLIDHEFFLITRFLPSNVIFVREYLDKANVVTEHGMSVFFDDNVKVIKSLVSLPCVHRIFWAQQYAIQHAVLSSDPTHIRRKELHSHAAAIVRGEVSKPVRHKISIMNDWAATMKYFQKIPTRINKRD